LSAAPGEPRSAPSPKLTLGSGGWLLLLAALLVLAASVWRLRDMFAHGGGHAVGDGRHLESYGFELSPCLVPREQLVGCGLPRDGLPVLDEPPLWNAEQVNALMHARSGKYLVPADRVIGVFLDGRARAYPLRALNWHEIVNDTLGGRPIAVTYSPLGDAAVVFGRVVKKSDGGADTISFGHSGLLYNSDLVMYDRRPGHTGESLFSQLQARAIAGPAAQGGRRLEILPSELLCWDDWQRLHPETTVLSMPRSQTERYSRDPYISYYGSDVLRFPVAPLPASREMEYKTECLALRGGEKWLLVPFPVLARHAGAGGTWTTEWEGRPLTLLYRGDPPSARAVEAGVADAAAGALPAVHCFWFAWFSTAPGDYEILR